MTKLSTKVCRETANEYQHRPIIVSLCPLGAQKDRLLGFRLKGTRTTYIASVAAIFRIAALGYAQREAAAKRAARKAGIPWKTARKQFLAANSI